MRYVFILLLAVFFLEKGAAQTPQPVYSFAKKTMPLPWYREQAVAWKKEIEKNPKNSLAWYYYYRVKRNLVSEDTADLRPRHEKRDELKQLVEQMGKEVPDSYDYHLCKWMNEGNNYEYLDHLKKAEELGAGRWEHLDCVATWAEVERLRDKREKACKDWFESGEASGGLLSYNYNMIAGLKANAIVFTIGDNDTYPIWILQSMGIRKDVTVLNLSLLHIEEYRQKMFKELGVGDDNWIYGSNEDSNRKVEERFRKEVISHVAGNKKGYPVYVSVTVSDEYCHPGHNAYGGTIADKLYLTGLTYEYSETPLDNIALIKRNFEQVYALDYLDKPFYQDVSIGLVKHLNGNYLVPMLKLYDHYHAAGEVQKMEAIRSQILKLANGQKQEPEVRKHLESAK